MLNIVLPILVFLSVVALGGAFIAAVISRRRAGLQPRLRPHADTFAGAALAPQEAAGLLKVAGRIGGAVSKGKTSGGLKEQMARAGFHGESAPAIYLGFKFLLLVIGIGGSVSAMLALELPLAVEIYLCAVAAAGFFFIPNWVVRVRRNRRRAEVQRFLPDAVDMLEICVSAGMGLDQAWNSVSDEIRGVSPIMADEMALTTLEIQLGAPRTVALRHMSERTHAAELASLVALLVQSERFGTSVAEALRTFAEGMRDTRSQRAEEHAEKMAVKLLFPLVFFIFPVMLIVMVGPAGITLYRIMSQ